MSKNTSFTLSIVIPVACAAILVVILFNLARRPVNDPIVERQPGWAGSVEFSSSAAAVFTSRVRTKTVEMSIPASIVFKNLDLTGKPCLTFAAQPKGVSGTLMCTLPRAVDQPNRSAAVVDLAGGRLTTGPARTAFRSLPDQIISGITFAVDAAEIYPTDLRPYLTRLRTFVCILPNYAVQRIEFSQETGSNTNPMESARVFDAYVQDVLSTIKFAH